MDVRIGNDVLVSIPISSFGDISSQDIKFMHCTFIVQNTDTTEDDQFSTFHHLSQYTVHGCGVPVYNVLPELENNVHEGPHDRGHIVCIPGSFETECKINDDNMLAVFPAEAQIKEGIYDCYFDVKVYEEGWGVNNIHSYRIKYSNVVTLSDKEGSDGIIVITPDIYVEEAPSDGNVYGRKDSDWVTISSGGMTETERALLNSALLPSDITNKAEKSDLDALSTSIGSLSDLLTTDKSSIVAAVNEAAKSGGSEGGTTDYNQLTNKPLIGGVTLTGNKTLAEIGASAVGHKHVKADITDFPESMPASDVSNWAKADTKPSYTASEIADGTTNVGAEVDDLQSKVSDLEDELDAIAAEDTTLADINSALDELNA